MIRRFASLLALFSMAFVASPAWADEYQDTINVFKKATESSAFSRRRTAMRCSRRSARAASASAAHTARVRVYEKGKYIGDTSMSQVTVGFQLGGQAYSQIVFFQDAQSLKQFTSGDFEFGAEASAVAITAGASAKANTSGSSAGASVTKNEAKNVGAYNKGMATFTVAKGGLMYEASIGGQKFNYKGR
jgi:hypothetical protein